MSDCTVITVCQGPPSCDLEGDEAVSAQVDGCPFCDRIYIDEFGNEQTVSPSVA